MDVYSWTLTVDSRLWGLLAILLVLFAQEGRQPAGPDKDWACDSLVSGQVCQLLATQL